MSSIGYSQEFFRGWVGAAAAPGDADRLNISRVEAAGGVTELPPCDAQQALKLVAGLPRFGLAVLVNGAAAVEFAARSAIQLRPPVLISPSFANSATEVANVAARGRLRPRRIEPDAVPAVREILRVSSRNHENEQALLTAAAELFGVASWPGFDVAQHPNERR